MFRKIFGRKRTIPGKLSFPNNIVVNKCTPNDAEIAEEWIREIEKEHAQFHSVNAAKWSEEQDFQWDVFFGAGEFIREEPYSSSLSEAIQKAIL